VSRAVVTKKVIDRLIREKLLDVCGGRATALPIVWRKPLAFECNWEVPGWEGDRAALDKCRPLIEPYVQLLCSQFDIASEA
jgi:hypothetical protein